MDKAHDDCEVLVVGAGPAGLAAAFRVAQAGSCVKVVDDNPDAGGQIWRGERAKTKSADAAAWFERIRSSRIEFVSGARVFHAPGTAKLEAETAAGIVELRYSSLILATGARERFLPFPGWTLPNVMGAGGLQALVKTGLPIEGKKVVIAGSGPLLLAVAAYLRDQGANVLLIAEQAPQIRLARFGLSLLRQGSKASQAIKLKGKLSGVRYLSSCWPIEAKGNNRLESVTLQRGNRTWEVACDYLACGFHLVPNLELAQLLNCEITDGAIQVDEFQETTCARVYSAGESTGIGGLELSLTEGEIAGLAAAGRKEEARKLFPLREKHRQFANVLNRTFSLRDELRGLARPETIVCRCEDVTLDRLKSHGSWREAKLQTRCGMGPCQGRMCGGAIEFMLGWQHESVRPPVFPVRVESLIAK